MNKPTKQQAMWARILARLNEIVERERGKDANYCVIKPHRAMTKDSPSKIGQG